MVNGGARADHFTIMGWNRIISGGRRGVDRGLERDLSSQIEVGNPGNGGKGVCILISNCTPWYTIREGNTDNEGCTKVSIFVVMVLDRFSFSTASVN